MSQEEIKLEVAKAALEYVPKNKIIGVGTGSTANIFIHQLAKFKNDILGAVASSMATKNLLEEKGIKVFELEEVNSIPIYIDGADEFDMDLNLIKGGGGALTREKIVAAFAKCFICIVDSSKTVKRLGKFPLPIEIIPMALNYVKTEIATRFGAKATLRKNFITDNGNLILDVSGMLIDNPEKLEYELNNIVGVVTNGLFANRKADIVLVASENGVKKITND